MEFFRETAPRAGKDHKCFACSQPISKGDKHTYMAMKSDGEFWSIRQHLECREAEIALSKINDLWGGEDGWLPLNEIEEQGDYDWLRDNHPKAFARIESMYPHFVTQGKDK